MISYVDPGCKPITEEEWYREFIDPRNGYLKRDTVAGIVVETSWVGVVADLERTPRPFLVRCHSAARDRIEKGQLVDRHASHDWFETIDDALEFHSGMVREILGGKKK